VKAERTNDELKRFFLFPSLFSAPPAALPFRLLPFSFFSVKMRVLFQAMKKRLSVL
jgi:hypothetical protein